MTLPARKALMALPYWPEPPGPALMSSMRLSANQRAVVADRGAQDFDAVVVGAGNGVARDDQAERIERHHGGGRDLGKNVAGDIAGDLLEPDAVAAAGRDLAIGDADVASAEAMHQAAPRRQRNAAAVERDTGQADAVGAFAQKHRGAAVEHEFGRAAHADQLRSALQAQHAGAIDARRQRQRHLRARGLVDRALQVSGLVVGTARAARHIASRRARAPTSAAPRARRPSTSQARRQRRRRMLQSDGGG